MYANTSYSDQYCYSLCLFYRVLIKLLKVTTTLLKFLRIEQEIDLETFIHVSDLHEGEEHGGVGGSGCKFYLFFLGLIFIHTRMN